MVLQFQQPPKKRRDTAKWFQLRQGSSFVPPDVPFVVQETVNAALPANATALDYLKLYFTDDIIQLIVCETNRYAEQ